MKTLFYAAAFLFTLWLSSLPSMGQPIATSEQLQDHSLRLIKTNNDFTQSKLSENQIDNKIFAIIRNSYDKKILIADMQIPLNYSKLTYLGYIHPNDTKLFTSYPINKENLEQFDKKLYIYKYDNFYVSTENNNAVDQQNVFYTIRAINILQAICEDVYKKLFTETLKPVSEKPKFTTFSNTNKAFWFGYNTNPKPISSNNTAFLCAVSRGPNDCANFVNVSIANFHSKNILGASPDGSKPVYNQRISWDNYKLHMSEGIIVSIFHEMLHNYIDYAFVDSDTYHTIKSFRDSTNFNLAEEAAVINTTYTYFKSKGILRPEQYKYYYSIFDTNLETLRQNNLLSRYAKAFSNTLPDSSNERKIFILPIP